MGLIIFFQFFQAQVSDRGTEKAYGDVRDAFKLGAKQTSAVNAMTHANVQVTAVAWSPPQVRSGHTGEPEEAKIQYTDSLVAAAGSSGVIAVWNASSAFFSEGSGESSTLANQQPEAILGQEHARAVNCLAWHPKRPGLLLSASQVRP